MNEAAQQLGRLAAGVPKKYSEEELQRRTLRILKAGKLRWKGKRKAKKVPEPKA